MIKTLFTYSLGLFSLILTVSQTCEDIPDFDYKSHPDQPFDFEHAEIRVTLEPELNLVRGVVTYSVSSKTDGATQLILQTEESAIDDILIDNIKSEFSVSQDSLIVELPDTSKAGEEFNIAITWQSNSRFGLYKDSKSNFWSSKNPLAHRHWLPGFDHPRNELTFDAYFTIPYESEVLFNGELVGDAAKPSNRKEIHYTSETAVPFTGLGFALGDFLISEVTSGLTTVRLFSSEKKYSEDARIALIREASQLKKDIEKKLSIEYPWEGLNIVILSDNFWEERTHGTGTIFLYENLGSLSNQLKRGLYTQWFGEYKRGEQFFDFEQAGDELMRTALHFLNSEGIALIDNPDTLNTIYSWNQWQKSFNKKSKLFRNTVKNLMPETTKQLKGLVTFDDYAEIWYKETGTSWFNITFDESDEQKRQISESIVYVLDVKYDDITSTLDLFFELTKEREQGGGELYNLSMMEYTFDDSVKHEVNFTGEFDTVSFKLSPSVEYISFTDGDSSLDQIDFGDFPLFFLLNQLRSEYIRDRTIAASLLVQYSDNPDLQLALNDVMDAEQHPVVKAALLETMASITNGAIGTEQQFLDGLNDAEVVQRVSISALKNYPDNDLVKSSLRSKILRLQSTSVFEKAVEVYVELANPNEVVSLTQRLARVDTTGIKSLYVINEYPEIDSNEVFLNLAENFLLDSYSYQTRDKSLNYLKENDSDSDRWVTRIKELLEDRDPRIRYQSLSAIKWLSASDALMILSSVEQNEFDVRVLFEADNLLEGLSE